MNRRLPHFHPHWQQPRFPHHRRAVVHLFSLPVRQHPVILRNLPD